MEQAEADLITAAREGDREALHGLYDRSHAAIFRLMVRIVGTQDAADLTQEVFLRAFRCLDQFSGRASFGTWLYRLAVNEALQYLRRQGRHKTVSLEREPVDTHDGQQGNEAEEKELLRCALDRIDPELRSVFILREVEKLSYAEIGDVVGIPEGTVGSRLNRARKELKEHLTRLGWGSDL